MSERKNNTIEMAPVQVDFLKKAINSGTKEDFLEYLASVGKVSWELVHPHVPNVSKEQLVLAVFDQIAVVAKEQIAKQVRQ